MSDRNWQDNFRGRCDYVGWVTELSANGHYKVFDGNSKFLFTYSKTAGDRRAMLNTLADAKRSGLEHLETQEKLRRERERLVRIEKDRETNGFVVSDVTTTADIHRESENENEVQVKTKSQIENHYADDRDTVLGHKVLIRQKASLPTRDIRTGACTNHPYPDIDELQLEDETLVYQCASRRDETCLFTSAKPESIRAHLRAHSPRAEAAKLAAELEEARRDAANAQQLLDERIRRKSEGSKRGAETRRRTLQAISAAYSGQEPDDAAKSSVENPEISRIRQTADALGREVDELSRGLQHVAKSLAQISNDLDRIPVPEPVDPVLLEKARAFEDLQAILGRAAS